MLALDDVAAMLAAEREGRAMSNFEHELKAIAIAVAIIVSSAYLLRHLAAQTWPALELGAARPPRRTPARHT